MKRLAIIVGAVLVATLAFGGADAPPPLTISTVSTSASSPSTSTSDKTDGYLEALKIDCSFASGANTVNVYVVTVSNTVNYAEMVLFTNSAVTGSCYYPVRTPTYIYDGTSLGTGNCTRFFFVQEKIKLTASATGTNAAIRVTPLMWR